MRPNEITRDAFINESYFPPEGGCFPISLLGAMAYSYPQMTFAETSECVKHLLGPVTIGDALYDRQNDRGYKQPYYQSTGTAYWNYLIHSGFGNELTFDVNTRLSRLGLDLQMDFLGSDKGPLALRLLRRGLPVILSLAVYENGVFAVNHTICFGIENGAIGSVDVNQKARKLDIGLLKYLVGMPSLRVDYIPQANLQLGWTASPIIFFEKKTQH